MFLQSLRKIGMGATTRRRPSRECNVGIECLDTRAVPAIVVPSPGSPLLESGLGTLNSNVLNVSWDEHGHAVAQITTLNPITGLANPPTSRLLASNVGPNGTLTDIPGVTDPNGTVTGNPTTLTYHLPVPVQDGDVAVYNFQTGQLSDVIRFHTVSDPVAGTQGYMLIYSDAPAEGSTETAAPADVGIPKGFPAHSVLTQSAVEFGVQGYDIVEYAAEQATYSGLSDGNAVSFGGA